MFGLVQKLCGGVTSLLLVRIRPATMRRSPLAVRSCLRNFSFLGRGLSGDGMRLGDSTCCQKKHSLRCPILLQMPFQPRAETTADIQELIRQWHEEHIRMQALVGMPRLVCLQLKRSRRLGDKDKIRVQIPCDGILMPEFEGSELQAGILPRRPPGFRAAFNGYVLRIEFVC